jgi:hypothetical protein
VSNEDRDIEREDILEKTIEELIDEMTCSNEKKTIKNETDTLSDVVVEEQFNSSSMFLLD